MEPRSFSMDLDINGQKVKYIEVNDPLTDEELNQIVEAYIRNGFRLEGLENYEFHR